MRIRDALALGALALTVVAAWWLAAWMNKGPMSPSGGLFFPGRFELKVPHFAQADPRWGGDPLGPTPGTLAAEGCAVASAAMVLAARGVETDPGRLNAFLTRTPGGYTPRGWIYWEKAPEILPGLAEAMLPHYEDAPSHFLVDWNLLRGNPVIARVRLPDGTTHFVVIHGKAGYEYLITDPGTSKNGGRRPLSELAPPVEAIRFYQPPRPRQGAVPSQTS